MLRVKRIVPTLILRFTLFHQSIFCHLIKHLDFFKKKLLSSAFFLAPRHKNKFRVITFDLVSWKRTSVFDHRWGKH